MPRNAPAANRTDLLVPQVQSGPGQPNGQPVQTPTGLPYGENQQLQQAQQAAPMAGPQTGPPPPPQGGPQAAMAAAKNFQMPQMDIMQPSQRPMEPVTAGLPGSPVGAPPPNTGTVSALLSKMAAATGSGALSSLASRAQSAGQ